MALDSHIDITVGSPGLALLDAMLVVAVSRLSSQLHQNLRRLKLATPGHETLTSHRIQTASLDTSLKLDMLILEFSRTSLMLCLCLTAASARPHAFLP